MFMIIIPLTCLLLIGIYTLWLIFLDIFCLFGVKQKAIIKEISIIEVPIGAKDIWFDLKISYYFEYKGVVYQSSRKNGFDNLLRKNRNQLEQLINPHNEFIPIYHLKKFPQYSMCFPLKFNKIIVTTLLFMGVVIPFIICLSLEPF